MGNSLFCFLSFLFIFLVLYLPVPFFWV
uniref:Uncharacterized protein n=1 Tax=Rhizophora mucronata TaxID=61149 RepID=A0A2P2QWW8_RHIMU